MNLAKNRTILRLITFVIIAAFLCENVVWAGGYNFRAGDRRIQAETLAKSSNCNDMDFLKEFQALEIIKLIVTTARETIGMGRINLSYINQWFKEVKKEKGRFRNAYKDIKIPKSTEPIFENTFLRKTKDGIWIFGAGWKIRFYKPGQRLETNLDTSDKEFKGAEKINDNLYYQIYMQTQAIVKSKTPFEIEVDYKFAQAQKAIQEGDSKKQSENNVKIVFDNNVPKQVQDAVMENIKLIQNIFINKMGIDINRLKEIFIAFVGQGSEKLTFSIMDPKSGMKFIGKVGKSYNLLNATEIARHQKKINEMDPYIYPELLAAEPGIIFEEFIEGPDYEELINSAGSVQEKQKLIREFISIWARLWDITKERVLMDAKKYNVKKTKYGPRIVDVKAIGDENYSIPPYGFLWHLWNHIFEVGYQDTFFNGIIEYFGERRGILLIKNALAECIKIDGLETDSLSQAEIRSLIKTPEGRMPYDNELTPEILLDWLIKEKTLGNTDSDSEEDQLTGDESEKSLITEDMPLHYLGQGLDIDFHVPVSAKKDGFWKYELKLTEKERESLNKRIMPCYDEKGIPTIISIVFYNEKPVLITTEYITQEQIPEDEFEKYQPEYEESYLSRLSKQTQDQASLPTPIIFAYSLIRTTNEDFKLTQETTKWLKAQSDLDVVFSDDLFQDYFIDGIEQPVCYFKGIYNPDFVAGVTFRQGIRPKRDSKVCVMGTGCGVDAIVAAQRGAGLVVATDNNPLAVACALYNRDRSPYKEKIVVVQADLFDIPGRPKDEKYSAIYFDIPVSYAREEFVNDPNVSDPGMVLLKRFLEEAKGRLEKNGVLVVGYNEYPKFLETVYRKGWEPVLIDGINYSRTIADVIASIDYVWFKLVPQKDPESRKKELTEIIETLKTLSESMDNMFHSGISSFETILNIIRPVESIYKKYKEIPYFKEQLLAKAAHNILYILYDIVRYEIRDYSKSNDPNKEQLITYLTRYLDYLYQIDNKEFGEYPVIEPRVNELYPEYLPEEDRALIKPRPIKDWLGKALNQFAETLEPVKLSEEIRKFYSQDALNKLADKLTDIEILKILGISAEDADILQNILRYLPVNPHFATSDLENSIGLFNRDKFEFPALLSLYIYSKLVAQKEISGALKNAGMVLTPGTILQMEQKEPVWRNMAKDIEAKTFPVTIENKKGYPEIYTITAKIIIDSSLPEEVRSWNIREEEKDKNSNLIIIIREPFGDVLTKEEEELLYHEECENILFESGISQRPAHILATCRQILMFAQKGKITPLHQQMIDNMTTEELFEIIKEYQSGRIYHYNLIKKYFNQVMEEIYKDYERMFKIRAALALFKKDERRALELFPRFEKSTNDLIVKIDKCSESEIEGLCKRVSELEQADVKGRGDLIAILLKWLNTQQFSSILGVDKTTLINRIRSGDIKSFIALGRNYNYRWYHPVKALSEYIGLEEQRNSLMKERVLLNSIKKLRKEDLDKLSSFIKQETGKEVDGAYEIFNECKKWLNMFSFAHYFYVEPLLVPDIIEEYRLRTFSIKPEKGKGFTLISPKSVAEMEKTIQTFLTETQKKISSRLGVYIKIGSLREYNLWKSLEDLAEIFPFVNIKSFKTLLNMEIYRNYLRHFIQDRYYIPPVEIERLKRQVVLWVRRDGVWKMLKKYNIVTEKLTKEEIEYEYAKNIILRIQKTWLTKEAFGEKSGYSKTTVTRLIREDKVDCLKLTYFSEKMGVYYIPPIDIEQVRDTENLMKAKEFLEKVCGVTVPSLDSVKALMVLHCMSSSILAKKLGVKKLNFKSNSKKRENTIVIHWVGEPAPLIYWRRKDAEKIIAEGGNEQEPYFSHIGNEADGQFKDQTIFIKRIYDAVKSNFFNTKFGEEVEVMDIKEAGDRHCYFYLEDTENDVSKGIIRVKIRYFIREGDSVVPAEVVLMKDYDAGYSVPESVLIDEIIVEEMGRLINRGITIIDSAKLITLKGKQSGNTYKLIYKPAETVRLEDWVSGIYSKYGLRSYDIDVNEDNYGAYAWVEYIENCTISDNTDLINPPNEKQAEQLGRICALGFLTKNNDIHGENLPCDKEGNYFLIDLESCFSNASDMDLLSFLNEYIHWVCKIRDRPEGKIFIRAFEEMLQEIVIRQDEFEELLRTCPANSFSYRLICSPTSEYNENANLRGIVPFYIKSVERSEMVSLFRRRVEEYLDIVSKKKGKTLLSYFTGYFEGRHGSFLNIEIDWEKPPEAFSELYAPRVESLVIMQAVNRILEKDNRFIIDTFKKVLLPRYRTKEIEAIKLQIVNAGTFNAIVKASVTLFNDVTFDFGLVVSKSPEFNDMTEKDFKDLIYLQNKYPQYKHYLQNPVSLLKADKEDKLSMYSVIWSPEHMELRVSPGESLGNGIVLTRRNAEPSWELNDPRVPESERSLMPEDAKEIRMKIIELLALLYDPDLQEGIVLQKNDSAVNRGDFVAMKLPSGEWDVKLITARNFTKGVFLKDFVESFLNHKEKEIGGHDLPTGFNIFKDKEEILDAIQKVWDKKYPGKDVRKELAESILGQGGSSLQTQVVIVFSQEIINLYSFFIGIINSCLLDNGVLVNTLNNLGVKLDESQEIEINFLYSGENTEPENRTESIFLATIKNGEGVVMDKFIIAVGNNIITESETMTIEDEYNNLKLANETDPKTWPKPYCFGYGLDMQGNKHQVYTCQYVDKNPMYIARNALDRLIIWLLDSGFYHKGIHNVPGTLQEGIYNRIIQEIIQRYVRLYLKTGLVPCDFSIFEGDILMSKQFYNELIEKVSSSKPNPDEVIAHLENNLLPSITICSLRRLKKGSLEDLQMELQNYRDHLRSRSVIPENEFPDKYEKDKEIIFNPKNINLAISREKAGILGLEKISEEDKSTPSGSVPSVFKMLCELENGFEGPVTIKYLAKYLKRSPETIKYDLNVLVNDLHLVEKIESKNKREKPRYRINTQRAPHDLRERILNDILEKIYTKPVRVNGEKRRERKEKADKKIHDLLKYTRESYYEKIGKYILTRKKVRVLVDKGEIKTSSRKYFEAAMPYLTEMGRNFLKECSFKLLDHSDIQNPFSKDGKWFLLVDPRKFDSAIMLYKYHWPFIKDIPQLLAELINSYAAWYYIGPVSNSYEDEFKFIHSLDTPLLDELYHWFVHYHILFETDVSKTISEVMKAKIPELTHTARFKIMESKGIEEAKQYVKMVRDKYLKGPQFTKAREQANIIIREKLTCLELKEYLENFYYTCLDSVGPSETINPLEYFRIINILTAFIPIFNVIVSLIIIRLSIYKHSSETIYSTLVDITGTINRREQMTKKFMASLHHSIIARSADIFQDYGLSQIKLELINLIKRDGFHDVEIFNTEPFDITNGGEKGEINISLGQIESLIDLALYKYSIIRVEKNIDPYILLDPNRPTVAIMNTEHNAVALLNTARLYYPEINWIATEPRFVIRSLQKDKESAKKDPPYIIFYDEKSKLTYAHLTQMPTIDAAMLPDNFILKDKGKRKIKDPPKKHIEEELSVVNSAPVETIARSKLKTNAILKGKNYVPVSLVILPNTLEKNIKSVIQFIKSVGNSAVLKSDSGARGEEVHMVSSTREVLDKAQIYQKDGFLIQERIYSPTLKGVNDWFIRAFVERTEDGEIIVTGLIAIIYSDEKRFIESDVLLLRDALKRVKVNKRERKKIIEDIRSVAIDAFRTVSESLFKEYSNDKYPCKSSAGVGPTFLTADIKLDRRDLKPKLLEINGVNSGRIAALHSLLLRGKFEVGRGFLGILAKDAWGNFKSAKDMIHISSIEQAVDNLAKLRDKNNSEIIIYYLKQLQELIRNKMTITDYVNVISELKWWIANAKEEVIISICKEVLSNVQGDLTVEKPESVVTTTREGRYSLLMRNWLLDSIKKYVPDVQNFLEVGVSVKPTEHLDLAAALKEKNQNLISLGLDILPIDDIYYQVSCIPFHWASGRWTLYCSKNGDVLFAADPTNQYCSKVEAEISYYIENTLSPLLKKAIVRNNLKSLNEFNIYAQRIDIDEIRKQESGGAKWLFLSQGSFTTLKRLKDVDVIFAANTLRNYLKTISLGAVEEALKSAESALREGGIFVEVNSDQEGILNFGVISRKTNGVLVPEEFILDFTMFGGYFSGGFNSFVSTLSTLFLFNMLPASLGDSIFEFSDILHEFIRYYHNNQDKFQQYDMRDAFGNAYSTEQGFFTFISIFVGLINQKGHIAIVDDKHIIHVRLSTENNTSKGLNGKVCLTNKETELINREYNNPLAIEIIEKLVSNNKYSDEFVSQLLKIMMDPSLGWCVRQLASMALEVQILHLNLKSKRRYNRLINILIELNVLKKDKDKVGFIDKDGLAKSGYPVNDVKAFVNSLIKRIRSQEYLYRRICTENRKSSDLGDFIYRSKQDDKHALFRFAVNAEQLLQQIKKQTNQVPKDTDEGETAGIAEYGYLPSRSLILNSLPPLERALVERIIAGKDVLLISPETPSDFNYLVTHPYTYFYAHEPDKPLETRVILIRTPGTSIEMQIKGSGIHGKNPFDIGYLIKYNKNLPVVVRTHVLGGGADFRSILGEYETGLRFAKIYYQTYGKLPDMVLPIDIWGFKSVRIGAKEVNFMEYFSNPKYWGKKNFKKLKQRVREVASVWLDGYKSSWSFKKVLRELLKEFCFGQLLYVRTTAFRLKTLAKYLFETGPDVYFREIGKSSYTEDDARRMADTLIEEILGEYVPPDIAFTTCPLYKKAAINDFRNKKRAGEIYKDLMKQMGQYWGAILGIGGTTDGYGFYDTNIGIKRVWENSEWKVKLVFHDLDSYYIPDERINVFRPTAFMRCFQKDARAIESPTEATMKSLIDPRTQIANLYEVDENTRREGLAIFEREVRMAFQKTFATIKDDTSLSDIVKAGYVETFEAWVKAVQSFLEMKNMDALSKKEWEKKTMRDLRKIGLKGRVRREYINSIIKNADFLRKHRFIFNETEEEKKSDSEEPEDIERIIDEPESESESESAQRQLLKQALMDNDWSFVRDTFANLSIEMNCENIRKIEMRWIKSSSSGTDAKLKDTYKVTFYDTQGRKETIEVKIFNIGEYGAFKGIEGIDREIKILKKLQGKGIVPDFGSFGLWGVKDGGIALCKDRSKKDNLAIMSERYFEGADLCYARKEFELSDEQLAEIQKLAIERFAQLWWYSDKHFYGPFSTEDHPDSSHVQVFRDSMDNFDVRITDPGTLDNVIDEKGLVEILCEYYPSITKEITRIVKEAIKQFSASDRKIETIKAKQKTITERFIDTVRNNFMRRDRKKIVLALDTDIGNMTQFETSTLFKQIKEVSGLLGDIEFVAGKGDTLSEEIGNTITDITGKGIDRNNIEVIVVTKKAKEYFDNSYHITRVDDKGLLGTGSYVPILELLTFALMINLGEVDSDLKRELGEMYIDITGVELAGGLIEQIRKGIFAIPLPKTEKIPKDFYDKSVEILSAA